MAMTDAEPHLLVNLSAAHAQLLITVQLAISQTLSL